MEMAQGVAGDGAGDLELASTTRRHEQLDKVRPHVVIDNHVIVDDVVADRRPHDEPQRVLGAAARERHDDRLGSSLSPMMASPAAAGSALGSTPWRVAVCGSTSGGTIVHSAGPDRATVAVAAHDASQGPRPPRRRLLGASSASRRRYRPATRLDSPPSTTLPARSTRPHGESMPVAEAQDQRSLPAHVTTAPTPIGSNGAVVHGDLDAHPAS